jgi:hypothetical protein
MKSRPAKLWSGTGSIHEETSDRPTSAADAFPKKRGK